MSPWLTPSIAIACATVGAVTDLRSGKIPNRLTLSAMACGVAIQTATRGLTGMVVGLLGLLICAIVPWVVYRSSQGRAIGGGDIKLFAALGALLGPTQGLEIELSSFMLIGVFALFRMAYLGQLGRTLMGSLRVTAGLFVPRLRGQLEEGAPEMTSIRMGPAIAAAVVAVLGLPFVQRWVPWLA